MTHRANAPPRTTFQWLPVSRRVRANVLALGGKTTHAIPSGLLPGSPLSLPLFCVFYVGHTGFLACPLNTPRILYSPLRAFEFDDSLCRKCSEALPLVYQMPTTFAESLSLTTLCRSCLYHSACPIPIILLIYSPKPITHYFIYPPSVHQL